MDKGINTKLSLIAIFVAISAFSTVLLLHFLTTPPAVTGLASNDLLYNQYFSTSPSRIEPPGFYCRDKGDGYACRDLEHCLDDAGVGDCIRGQHCCTYKPTPAPQCSDYPGYVCIDPTKEDTDKWDCKDAYGMGDLCGGLNSAGDAYLWCCKKK